MAQFLQVPAKDLIVSLARICPEPESGCLFTYEIFVSRWSC